MKSKLRFLPVIIIALACCLMTACNKVYYWEVAQSVENISKIEIYANYGLENQELLCEISSEDYEEIVDDIQAMPARKYFGEPFRSKAKVIILTFADNNYDIIALYEPSHVTVSDGGRISWLYFDKNQFNQLIEKWIAKS